MMRVDGFAEACRLENLTKKFSEQNEVVESYWFSRDERHDRIVAFIMDSSACLRQGFAMLFHTLIE